MLDIFFNKNSIIKLYLLYKIYKEVAKEEFYECSNDITYYHVGIRSSIFCSAGEGCGSPQG